VSLATLALGAAICAVVAKLVVKYDPIGALAWVVVGAFWSYKLYVAFYRRAIDDLGYSEETARSEGETRGTAEYWSLVRENGSSVIKFSVAASRRLKQLS
jgi:hypothetical protein